ncbi:hypothetical protein GO988_12840 [Hymenobacter sp. HMF4947]|uniref:Uncharacterized protein n=1 Tax=Hymenobacter ginkgonis TaxID=2682976 RepID=A0A7K1TFM1_9BACT|nr:hypothetical protein [Hymenobacter ginkgonis]MVN77214.1 hypothetical protein [Hymenobacter ginkgonis]
MKLPLLLVGLLLLALLLPPAGHSAHRRHRHAAVGRCPGSPQLLPLRVLRTAQSTQGPKVVRAVGR